MSNQYQPTNKAPTLILGVAALIVGLIFLLRRFWYAGVALAVIGIALLIYSTTIHEWCAPKNVKFGAAFGEMMWKSPSVHDCLRLVYGSW